MINEREHYKTQLALMKYILLELRQIVAENPSRREFYTKRISHRLKMINILEEKLAISNGGN